MWASLAVAALLAAWTWRWVSIDMSHYLVPWFDHIVAAGPVGAFAAPFANYTPPYLYLLAASTALAGTLPAVAIVKLVALLGTAALGVSVHRLLSALGAPRPARGAALAVALPSIALNAAALGQCDAWWAAPCVMAVATAVERRHAAMLGWFGLAVAVKAQAAFLAPFVAALLLQRRVPLRLWPIAPAAGCLAMLPALAAGWPPGDLAGIYWRQADTFQLLAFNAPNIWMIVQMLPGVAALPPLTALALAAAAGAAMAYVAAFSHRPLDGRHLIGAALLAVLLVAGLLPRMHERFFFLADVLALALAATARTRSFWTIAALVEAGSALGLAAFMARLDVLAVAGATAMILATLLLLRGRPGASANDNPLFPAHRLAPASGPAQHGCSQRVARGAVGG